MARLLSLSSSSSRGTSSLAEEGGIQAASRLAGLWQTGPEGRCGAGMVISAMPEVTASTRRTAELQSEEALPSWVVAVADTLAVDEPESLGTDEEALERCAVEEER